MSFLFAKNKNLVKLFSEVVDFACVLALNLAACKSKSLSLAYSIV